MEHLCSEVITLDLGAVEHSCNLVVEDAKLHARLGRLRCLHPYGVWVGDEAVDKLGDVIEQFAVLFVEGESAFLIVAHPSCLAFAPACVDAFHSALADGTHHGDG